MSELRKYGVATKILFPLIDRGAQDFENTPVVHVVGDTQINIDEAGFGNTINAFVHEGLGIYSLSLTIAELTGARIVVTIIDTAPKAWEDQAVLIETYGHANAQHAFDLDTATQSVNTAQIEGGDPTDAIQASATAALTAYDPPTDAEMLAAFAALNDLNAAAVQAAAAAALVAYDPPTDAEMIVAFGTIGIDVTAIRAQTDNLPSGVPRNVALNDFEFLLVQAADHVTPALGAVVVAEISQDGGPFVACANAVAEISDGLYSIDLTAGEMNAVVITLKFTAGAVDQRTVTILTST